MATKTEAASRVRSVLQSVKDRLAQPGGAKVNEATTRAHFLNPLLGALGYESIDDIEFEHYLPDGKTFLDYRLRVDGKARVAVEAKALDSALADKDAAQVIAYAAVLGDEWAVLTNARRWDLYHAFAQVPLAQKRILSVDLTGWSSDSEFTAVFEQLWLISRDAFTTGDGPGSWLTTKKLDQLLKATLTDESSSEVKFIRKRMEQAGVNASNEQIAAWFKVRVETGPEVPKSKPPESAYAPAVGSPVSTVKDSTEQYVSSMESATSTGYWIIPSGKQGGYSATEHLKAWLDKGFWGFGESTPGRKSIKVGDRVAFYAAKSQAVVAHAVIAGDLNTLVTPTEWPGPGIQTQPIYKVPLSDVTWLSEPILLDKPLRGALDAYAGKSPDAGWSWLIQTTHRVSKRDFERLTGQ